MKYRAKGDIRGGCPHLHRLVHAAYACAMQDHAGAKAQGGYSDRRVQRADGEPLTDCEIEWLAAAARAVGKADR